MTPRTGVHDRRTIRPAWMRRASSCPPVEAFQRLLGAGRRPAFLHTGGPETPGSWSLVACDPDATFSIGPRDPDDPFDRLRRMLAAEVVLEGERPPVPFIGGWVGAFSYDLAHRTERLRTAARIDHGFPLIELARYPRVLAYDHDTAAWTACELAGPETCEGGVRSGLERLLDLALDGPLPPRETGPTFTDALQSNFSRDAYEAAVCRVLDYIAAGDTYQVNLSQRFEARLAVSPEELALRLFEASPAPFSAFVRFDGRAIVSSSPELFLRVRGREVETRPIKGTRPRGATPDEDERLKTELVASPKERAELVMITDLLRNDLGRVCEYGSVRVPELRVVESYRNVHHTYSRIVGRLKEDAGLADLLRATLPGGSVTGAPKVRSMEIIEELEPTARGPYCGAIGWIGADGAMDLNIVIRTILVEADGATGRRLTFQVGGGIVADSDPAAEYEETLDKAQGILRALRAGHTAHARRRAARRPAMNRHVILNGRLVPPGEACVSVDDRGFLYGDSVFTTLRCYAGVPFRLDRHVTRLNASLHSPIVAIAYTVDENSIRDDIARLVAKNGCLDAVVRLRVTRGRGAGPLPPKDAAPTTLLTVDPVHLDESLYARGARLIVSSERRDPHGKLGRHKLGSYLFSLVARREAAAAGADEAIIADTDGHWLECACSNLFAVVEGALVTPDVTENLLPGIARETVLECARDLGIPVSLQTLTAEITERAEEWFITNSVQEIVPVARVTTKSYTAPGPVAAVLARAYREAVAREAAGA
ncbi:MAG: aminodeoxychorismate synthase component I [Verrucomicrobia bacterium]|nr:aminodeoxychorismate synthase component I [Verrucomicrobiota bacterium]